MPAGPIAEHDRVAIDCLDVALLVHRLRPDRLAARRDDVEGQHLERSLGSLAAQHRHASLDGVGVSVAPTAEQRDEFFEQRRDDGVLATGAGDRDLVSAHVDVAVESLLDDAQQFVARPEQTHHRVRTRHDNAGLRGGWVGRASDRLVVGPRSGLGLTRFASHGSALGAYSRLLSVLGDVTVLWYLRA